MYHQTKQNSTHMTRSEIFTAAHATAKATRKNFATYRAAFASALKAAYAPKVEQAPVYVVFDRKTKQATAKYATAQQLVDALALDCWAKSEMIEAFADGVDASDLFCDYSNMRKSHVCFDVTADLKFISMSGYKF